MGLIHLINSMNKITQIIITFILGVGASLVVMAPPVSAAPADYCDNASNQNACNAGYNGGPCTTGTYSDAQARRACQTGKDGAEKDKQNGTYEGTNGETGGTGSTTPPNGENKDNKCGGAKTEIVSCDEEAGLGAIASIIKTAIMIVTIIIGIVAVGGITYAAILYASARDNQSQVQEAITIIRNVVIGLALYGFSIAIINWLVPGGVIG